LRSVGLVGRVSGRLGAFLARNARPTCPAPSVRTGLSEDGRYPDFCWRAATEDEVFAGFWRQSEYNEVLGLDPSAAVISNYAFSELVGPVQEASYERILSEATRGYLVFNDIGGSALGTGRVTAQELCSGVGGRILPETPFTGRRNQLVVWGTS
jgi:hypothetical protein